MLTLGVLLLHLVLEPVHFRFELLLSKCQLLNLLLLLFVLPDQRKNSIFLLSAQIFEFCHLYCLLVNQPLFLLEGSFNCLLFLLQLSYLLFECLGFSVLFFFLGEFFLCVGVLLSEMVDLCFVVVDLVAEVNYFVLVSEGVIGKVVDYFLRFPKQLLHLKQLLLKHFNLLFLETDLQGQPLPLLNSHFFLLLRPCQPLLFLLLHRVKGLAFSSELLLQLRLGLCQFLPHSLHLLAVVALFEFIFFIEIFDGGIFLVDFIVEVSEFVPQSLVLGKQLLVF